MSLRNDMHLAFDELAPSTTGLSERVVLTVLDRTARRRRSQILFRFRAPLSLVAVLLMIALVVGVLVGGRLLSDWQRTHQRPVPVGIDQAVLRQLEARPIVLPTFKSGQVCATGPFNDQGWWGAGPVYFTSTYPNGPGGARNISTWGLYIQFKAETGVSLQGPILIRAYDFGIKLPVVFVGRFATGPPAGTDIVSGQQVQQYPELVLDASHPVTAANAGLIAWPFSAGMKDSHASQRSFASGTSRDQIDHCTFWQIDGQTFTETLGMDLV